MNNVTFRYHNPNTDDETLKYISELFINASRVKFENILREAALNDRTELMEKESS
jgi:hypothetical protein